MHMRQEDGVGKLQDRAEPLGNFISAGTGRPLCGIHSGGGSMRARLQANFTNRSVNA